MILITGASGKTGRSVLAALARAGAKTRALVQRPSQVESLIAIGAREVVVGDLRDPTDMRRAFEGARAVYHICPNMHPDEAAIGRAAIGAAREAGLEHFVFHSVLHPRVERMPHHWNKSLVEEDLFESGMDFTILQPTAYMQNLLGGWEQVLRGILRNPYPVATRLSLVDLEDVAQAAALVLTHDGHRNATYELVGTTPMTQAAVAETLSEALGRPVVAEEEPLHTWEARGLAAGLKEYPRAALKAMFHYYAEFGMAGSPTVLRWLLGREPTTLVGFARRFLSTSDLPPGSG